MCLRISSLPNTDGAAADAAAGPSAARPAAAALMTAAAQQKRQGGAQQQGWNLQVEVCMTLVEVLVCATKLKGPHHICLQYNAR